MLRNSSKAPSEDSKLNDLLNQSIGSDILDKYNPLSLISPHSFCKFHDKTRLHSGFENALAFKDSKGLAYFQKVDLISNLMPKLQQIGYHHRLNKDHLNLIGFVMNYYTLLILEKVQPKRPYTEESIFEELQRMKAVRMENMTTCLNHGFNISNLLDCPDYKKISALIQQAITRKFRQERELYDVFKTICHKIYQDLWRELKQAIDAEARRAIIQVLVRVVYIILLPKMNIQDEEMMKYYNKWRLTERQDMSLFSLNHLERYFEKAGWEVHVDDIAHLTTKFL